MKLSLWKLRLPPMVTLDFTFLASVPAVPAFVAGFVIGVVVAFLVIASLLDKAS